MTTDVHLKIHEELRGEIAHHYNPRRNEMIFSRSNHIFGNCGALRFEFMLPLSVSMRVMATTRLVRRLTRTDKSNAVFNHARDGIVILYRSQIYFYNLRQQSLQPVRILKQCRNVLHSSIAVTEHGLYIGEYCHNAERKAVPVYASYDDGRSWSTVHEFPSGSIKHIHGIYKDPYTDSLWITTGDFAGECYVFEVPKGDFSSIIKHGDGSQRWRTVSLFFEPEHIVWAMDSQLQTSHLQIFDRETAQIIQKCAFPGPVWYSKHLVGGFALLQSTVEIGPGSQSDHCHIFASRDLEEWTEVRRFKKDIWPKRYFKFGVTGFADGDQPLDDFVMFGEALSGFDGKIFRAGLQWKS